MGGTGKHTANIMSKYYRGKRTRNIYDPNSDDIFRISRSKIDLFINCPKCFYIDRRLGVGQPPGYPFSLNSAVDNLLKNEFDHYRLNREPHPLMKEAGLDAIPVNHADMDAWRDSLRRGITYQFPDTNLLITGGIDDVWMNKEGEFIIVDYKATSKAGEVTLDADWQIGYKRQMEIYQWLFRKNDFQVNSIGYFVYCNGDGGKDSFDGRLDFDIKLIPYEGDDSWVDATIKKLYQCLQSDDVPESGSECDYCTYREAVQLEVSC